MNVYSKPSLCELVRCDSSCGQSHQSNIVMDSITGHSSSSLCTQSTAVHVHHLPIITIDMLAHSAIVFFGPMGGGSVIADDIWCGLNVW
jgi:hypothetical protein